MNFAVVVGTVYTSTNNKYHESSIRVLLVCGGVGVSCAKKWRKENSVFIQLSISFLFIILFTLFLCDEEQKKKNTKKKASSTTKRRICVFYEHTTLFVARFCAAALSQLFSPQHRSTTLSVWVCFISDSLTIQQQPTYWLGLDDASVTYREKSTASRRRPLNSARGVRGGDERETSALTPFFGGFCQRTTLFSASLPTKSNRAIFLRPRSIASQQDLTRGERCKIFASSKMDMAFRDAQATKLDGWTNRWSRSQKSIDDVP